MNIKEILHIRSFSAIVGGKQPPETCPMIDNHIGDLNAEIRDWNQWISEYESNINELESNKEEDNSREIAKLNNKIEDFHTNIKQNEDKIKYFEQDRRTISCTRDIGLANRSDTIALLETSLISYNNRLFICVNDILKDNIHAEREEFKLHLNNSHSDVVKNYEKIVEWVQSWTGCGEKILDHISSNIIKVPIDLKDKELFSILIPKIEKHIIESKELDANDKILILRLFPEMSFFQGEILNIDKLKEEYFYYLD